MKFVVSDEYRNYYTYSGADYKLYESLEAIYEKFKSKEVRYEISKELNSNKDYSLKDLEKVLEILTK